MSPRDSTPSGRFVLRIDPILHGALAGQAHQAGKSLNALITERLERGVYAYDADLEMPGRELSGPRKRVTFAMIAQAAGCSKATVSRALAGDLRIGEATRHRVQTTAREMGYRPDPALGSLAAHRWGRGREMNRTVGMVVPNENQFHRVGEGVIASAKRMGYRVDTLAMDTLGGAERVVKVARARGLYGLIFLPVPDDQPTLHYNLDGLAGICVVRTSQSPPVHGVTGDMFLPTLDSILTAVERGYRRISPVLYASPQFEHPGTSTLAQQWRPVQSGDIAFSNAEQHIRRRAAVALLREELAGRAEVLPSYEGPIGRQGRRDMASWVRQQNPDCVVGLNDSVFWGLWEAGMKAPHDLGYCSILGSRDKPDVLPQCTGFLPHFDEMAALAVNWLDQLLRHHETGYPERPQTLRVEPEWKEGDTLPRKC